MQLEGKLVPSQYIYKKQEMVPIEKILTGIDLSKIKFVEFHGGEPLMASYPWEIISLLDKTNISVKINTNGTIWPESMYEFVECQLTEIIFSIDDIDKRLEYLRPPAKFDQLLKNIKQAQAMKFNIGCTYVMSGLNIYYLPEFIEWGLRTFGINLYGQLIYEPSEYSLYNLPILAKHEVERKFSQHSKFNKLLQPALDNMFRHQQQYPKELLKLASTKEFNQAMPEWGKILND
jgi:MoaA/NifB/PqqE/SkfB family radical SAM enzyme